MSIFLICGTFARPSVMENSVGPTGNGMGDSEKLIAIFVCGAVGVAIIAVLVFRFAKSKVEIPETPTRRKLTSEQVTKVAYISGDSSLRLNNGPSSDLLDVANLIDTYQDNRISLSSINTLTSTKYSASTGNRWSFNIDKSNYVKALNRTYSEASSAKEAMNRPPSRNGRVIGSNKKAVPTKIQPIE